MRKYLKIIAFAFCFAVCSCLVTSGVNAETKTLSVVFLETNSSDPSGVSESLDAKYNVWVEGGATFESLSKLSFGNQVVFCIEPTILTENGEMYENGDITKKLTKDMQERLEEIAYVGYGYQGDTSNEMLGATQIRMWQEQGYTVNYIHTDLQKKIDQINERLKMFDKNPSFNGKTVQFDVLKTGKENNEILIDTNQVFSQFNKNIKASAKYEINGNNLSIWREKGNPMTGTYSFDLIDPSDVGTSTAFVSNSGKQTVAEFKMSNPHRVTVKYITEKAKVTISKTDITTGEELSGSHLSITDKESGKVIEEWISDGKIHEIDGDKFVDGKEYILHEDTAPEGYQVSQDITFTYDEEGMELIVMKDERIVENPETGLSFPYIMLGGGAILAVGGVIYLMKKNKFKSLS